MNKNEPSQTKPSTIGWRHILTSLFFSDWTGGLLLLIATTTALVLTNVFHTDFVNNVWNFNFKFKWLSRNFNIFSLRFLVNDVGMTLFFFLIGLEIKDELKNGLLSSWKNAALPVFAAIGGMIIPAVIYLLLTHKGDFYQGWAIPVATDIAFAGGIMALLGRMIPTWAKLCLTAIAVVDDIGSILVIALFYNHSISWIAIAFSALLVMFALVLEKMGKQKKSVLVIISFLVWIAVFYSGLHVTLAGLIIAGFWPENLLNRAGEDTNQFLQKKLHQLITWIILPLFALGNSSIIIPQVEIGHLLKHPLFLGVFFGLLLGKPIGIIGFSALAVRFNVAQLPKLGSWKIFIGLAIIAGMGFTMSIFMTQLAFSDKLFQDVAKIAILLASSVSAIAGIVYYWFIREKFALKAQN